MQKLSLLFVKSRNNYKNKLKTRNSERTKRVSFPPYNFNTLTNSFGKNSQTGIGIKDKSLMTSPSHKK